VHQTADFGGRLNLFDQQSEELIRELADAAKNALCDCCHEENDRKPRELSTSCFSALSVAVAVAVAVARVTRVTTRVVQSIVLSVPGKGRGVLPSAESEEAGAGFRAASP
jgi:hypothetical protein